jgi:RNA polymerase sigma factor (sigma-70 family)
MLALVESDQPLTTDGPVAGRQGRAERLAMEAQRGDPAALRELLSLLGPYLLGVARAILGAGTPDLEDVAQESLLGLVRALPAFRAEASIRHYAGRIAARIAIAARRRAREDQHRLEAMQRASIAPGALLASHDADALAARRRHLLRSLLDELPEAQAETLALRVVMGYSMEEVAATTGAPLNTVRSRLRLAKESLRKRIEQDAGAREILEEGA